MNTRVAALHIMVVAASPERRAQLASLCSRAARGRVTSSPAILLEQIFQSAPDQLLVDVDGPRVASALLRTAEALPASTGIVALVDNPEVGWVRTALHAGINAILSREVTPEELNLAVLAAENGLILLNPSTAEALGWQSTAQPDESLEMVDALTAREQEVLRLVSEGLANKEIAARLNISEHTVKFHISSILGKLGAASRTEAVSQGIRKGFIVI